MKSFDSARLKDRDEKIKARFFVLRKEFPQKPNKDIYDIIGPEFYLGVDRVKDIVTGRRTQYVN